jgi:hypothetical protein
MDAHPIGRVPETERARGATWQVLEGEQRIEWTLLEPSPTPAHGASADEQTGSADDGVGAPSAAAAQPPPPPPEDLPAMLERLQLTHLSKLLAAEEIDLALLRSMTNFPEELAELGASEEELRKLEAAVLVGGSRTGSAEPSSRVRRLTGSPGTAVRRYIRRRRRRSTTTMRTGWRWK